MGEPDSPVWVVPSPCWIGRAMVLHESAARVIMVQEIDDSFMMYTIFYQYCWSATHKSTKASEKSTC